MAGVSVELLTVSSISLQSAGSLLNNQTNSQKNVNMSTDVIGDNVNDYLTLFDESRKGTALLIHSSCLPCGHECNVLTDCTVLGDVLCHRNTLQ